MVARSLREMLAPTALAVTCSACVLVSSLDGLVASSPQGPISYVQSAGNYWFSSGMPTFYVSLGAVTAGDTIIAAFSWSGVGSLAVADSQGNVYQEAVTSADGNAIYFAKNVKAGDTMVTVTFAQAMTGVFYAHEYAGLSTTSPLDQTSAASGAATSFDSGAKTTTFARELVFGYASVADKAVVGAGYNMRQDAGGNMSEDILVSSPGSYRASFSQDKLGVPSSGAYTALMATFH